MHPIDDLLILAGMAVFGLGAAGCLLVIPVVGFKFGSVLFERDPEPPESSREVRELE